MLPIGAQRVSMRKLVLILPALLLLSGCGPTAEQVHQYEHVLAAVGAAMGVGMWALGRRIGWRLGGKGIPCPDCGNFNSATGKAGSPATCPRCGKGLKIACLDAVTFARLTGRPTWSARLRLVKWAAILALATFAVLSIPSMVAWVSPSLREFEPRYENVLLFPIWFAHFEPRPYIGLGVSLFFYSYHLLGLPGLFGVYNLERCWWIGLAYFMTLLAIGFYWYLGLRLRRWGWLAPILWGAANAVFATVAYLAHWH